MPLMMLSASPPNSPPSAHSAARMSVARSGSTGAVVAVDSSSIPVVVLVVEVRVSGWGASGCSSLQCVTRCPAFPQPLPVRHYLQKSTMWLLEGVTAISFLRLVYVTPSQPGVAVSLTAFAFIASNRPHSAVVTASGEFRFT